MLMYFRIILLIGFILTTHVHTALGQKPKRWSSSEIHDAIKKLNFLGSALYVAAHPDDENTRLIAYLANDVKANVAYLSLTRGDGGQNLIGPEIREQLGVIRTQELLAARSIDGGKQLFSRANDFGFSKTAAETLEIWNEDEVLSDVVWAIRKWQPDIIVNRFQHFEQERLYGRMHGHHTASAMLSHRAFDMTGREDVYPEQLKYVETWQPKRLFFNTSWFFFRNRDEFENADKSDMIALDVGTYLAKTGKSVPEIAAESRSMHKSQGFGSTGSRGKTIEYLQLLKGDMPVPQQDLFSGVNTTWSRVNGGEAIGKLLSRVIENFDYDNPAKSISGLLGAYRLMDRLPDGYWKRTKIKEIKEVIKASMGLYLEAVANDFSATPTQEITLNIEAINRSMASAKLVKLSIPAVGIDTTFNTELSNNEKLVLKQRFYIPEDGPFTSAYWLKDTWELGMYTVKDQSIRGLPETPRNLAVTFLLDINGTTIPYTTDVVYKRNDPVDGEVYRPFEVLPPVVVNMEEKVLLFGDEGAKTAKVVVKSGADSLRTTVRLDVPDGWDVKPKSHEVYLSFKGEEQVLDFVLTPPSTQSEGDIKAIAVHNGKAYTQEMLVIEYDHIPTQTILTESKARVVRVDLKRAGDNIGYLMGAGDALPEQLKQVGYQVTLLEDADINVENLKRFDAVVLGVRAYNTIDRMKVYQPRLLQYVKEGGTLVVQYNTTRRLKVPMDQIGPYPITLSRDRVTKEEAPVTFLAPKHPVLNYPNTITEKDFEGWVQERGLYFPNKWDEKYTPILAANDPTEPAREGGLLVANYGEGHYVYTGYSFFREFPAGVAGAYRLFANLLALGKQDKP